MPSLRTLIPGLASGFAAVFTALAAHASPERELTVSQWAEKYREVSAESGSPVAGKWLNARQPCLIEPMDACQIGNGVQRVVLTGSAQFGKSEVSLNALAWAIDYTPRVILVLLPSLEEVTAYALLKFDPMVSATPRMRERVMLRKSRSNEGSTTKTKKFRGGSLWMVTAGASKGLQMKTAGLVVCEEVAQYDPTVGEGGDPITAAEGRMINFKDEAKTILVSTPGFIGGDNPCRITAEYNASDMRRWFTPCPHCGDASVLEFKTLAEHEGRPVFSCESCGGVIEEMHKRDMNVAGFWLPTFEHPEERAEDRARNPAPPKIIPAAEISAYAPFDPVRGYRFAVRDTEGRARGYWLWQAQSNFSSWAYVLKRWRDVEAGDGGEPAEIEFSQKILGLAYERKVERPDDQKLYEARGQLYPEEGVVPEWASIVVGAIDVQHNRLEYAVYAFGRGSVGARIATGVIPKNPLDWDTWRVDAAALVNTTFKGRHYKARLADYWAVDSGGNATENVYNFCFPLQYRPQPVLAIKGKSESGANKGDAPAFDKGSKVTVWRKGRRMGVLQLWLIGTHALKARVYHGLAAGIIATESKKLEPRALLFPRQATKEHFKQLTAEHLKRDDPRERGYWHRPAGQANEQLDMAVYCMALAINEGLDRLDELGWAERAAARMPDQVEAELTPLERLARAEPEDAPPVLEAPPAEGADTTLDLAAIERAAEEMGKAARGS